MKGRSCGPSVKYYVGIRLEKNHQNQSGHPISGQDSNQGTF
jgi:hypothetical protein